MKPTKAQLNALQLALDGAIRYYKGGSYSNPYQVGGDNRTHHCPPYRDRATIGTLRACVKRGWMAYVSDEDVYKRRWKITNEGINVLNEVENKYEGLK